MFLSKKTDVYTLGAISFLRFLDCVFLEIICAIFFEELESFASPI